MTASITSRDDTPLDVVALYIFMGVSALLVLLATAATPDPLFRFHGYILTGSFIAAVCAMSALIGAGRLRSDATQ